MKPHAREQQLIPNRRFRSKGILIVIILRNFFAVILGFFGGSVVNMAFILIGPNIIPPPEGVDPSNAESLAENMHLFQPQHFIFPFIAHAGGTLVGAVIAFLFAGSYRTVFAYVIGGLFLMGGITMTILIPFPMWSIIVDLVGAYIPMAWIGARIGQRITQAFTPTPALQNTD